MHIAHFSNTYHPVISGVVRSVSAFRKALTDLGHNVFVFAQEAEGYEDQEPFIFRYPTLGLPLPAEFPAILPVSPVIDAVIPSLKLDIIHTHHPVLVGQAAANKAEELDLPLVFTFHTQYREYSHYFPIPQDVVQKFVKETIETWLERFMRRCHHIVVPSHGMRDILNEEYGLKDQVTVIPTGIELEPYQKADGEPIREKFGWENDFVLISVGRLAEEKNWKTLLTACAQVMQDHPNFRTVLIGDGPQREELEEFATELGYPERIEFLGKIPFEEIPSHLKAADLFGFASVTETQGLVTLEALAAGLPVAAVDAIGTSDVIEDGQQGFLTENDSQALANAIRKIVDNPQLRQRFCDATVSRAKKFEILTLAEKMIDVYHQAEEQQRAGRRVVVRKS